MAESRAPNDDDPYQHEVSRCKRIDETTSTTSALAAPVAAADGSIVTTAVATTGGPAGWIGPSACRIFPDANPYALFSEAEPLKPLDPRDLPENTPITVAARQGRAVG